MSCVMPRCRYVRDPPGYCCTGPLGRVPGHADVWLSCYLKIGPCSVRSRPGYLRTRAGSVMDGSHAPRLADLLLFVSKYTQIEKNPCFAMRHCVDLSFTVEYHIDLIPGSPRRSGNFPAPDWGFYPGDFFSVNQFPYRGYYRGSVCSEQNEKKFNDDN